MSFMLLQNLYLYQVDLDESQSELAKCSQSKERQPETC